MPTLTVEQHAAPSPPPRTVASPAEAALRRRLLEVLAEPVPPGRITYEEFLAWADGRPPWLLAARRVALAAAPAPRAGRPARAGVDLKRCARGT